MMSLMAIIAISDGNDCHRWVIFTSAATLPRLRRLLLHIVLHVLPAAGQGRREGDLLVEGHLHEGRLVPIVRAHYEREPLAMPRLAIRDDVQVPRAPGRHVNVLVDVEVAHLLQNTDLGVFKSPAMMMLGSLDWPCDEARAARDCARCRATWSMMFVAHRALNMACFAAFRPGAACVPRPSTVWHDTAMAEAPVGDVIMSAWNTF